MTEKFSPLCVLCEFCPRHKARDVTILKDGMRTTTFDTTLTRTCGAGDSKNPDARCENGKFQIRNTVVVFQMADSEAT